MFNLLKTKEAATAAPAPLPEGLTLAQVREALLRLMAEESSNHHRMGQYYNYVVDKRLAEKAGFKDARDFFSKHLADLSQSALSQYGTVAAAFSESVARRFGVTCLYMLLTYQEAADVEVNNAEPGGTLIEVPQENGQVQAKPFGECTAQEMRQALQRKRKPSSSKPLPVEALELAEQYREAVVGRFPQGVLVKVAVRNQKGKAVLDFKGIPVEQVARLVQALTNSLPEADPAPEAAPAPELQRVVQAEPS